MFREPSERESVAAQIIGFFDRLVSASLIWPNHSRNPFHKRCHPIESQSERFAAADLRSYVGRLRGGVMKSRWLLLTTALVLAISGVVVYRLWKADRRSALQQTSNDVPTVSHIDKGSVSFSPQKDRGVAVINEKGRAQLWMISVADNRRSLVMQLERGEDARDIR